MSLKDTTVSKFEQSIQKYWGALYDSIVEERDKFESDTTNHAWLTMALTKMHEVRHWTWDHVSDLEHDIIHEGVSLSEVKDSLKVSETEKVNKSA